MPPQYGYRPQRFGTGQSYRSPMSLSYQRYYGAPDPWGELPGFGPPRVGVPARQPFTPAQQAPSQPARAPAQAPPDAQPQGQPQGQQQPQAPAGVAYDWSTDPIFQKIQALGIASRENARDEAARVKKEAAIRFGDEGFARKVTGDEATALAARENPFSVEKLLARDLEDQTREIDLDSNRHNLFFSGARARALGDATRGHQQRRHQAMEDLQGLLGGVESRLLAALSGADWQDMEAEEAARNRALEFALANRVDPGAAGGGESVPGGGDGGAGLINGRLPTGDTVLDAILGDPAGHAAAIPEVELLPEDSLVDPRYSRNRGGGGRFFTL